MKVSRKALIIYTVPIILAAIAVWHLAERRKGEPVKPITDKPVQIFARTPQPRAELGRQVAALSSILKGLDGGAPSSGPADPQKIAEVLKPSATLKGVIADYYGNTPGACTVYLRPAQPGELAPHSVFSATASSGTDGLVTAQGIGAGAWDLLARCEKGLGRLRSVRVAAEGVTDFGVLKLDSGGAVRGTILETGTKKPVAGAAVSIDSPYPNPSMPEAARVFATPADQDGRFEFEGVPAGKWNMKIEAGGYLMKDLQGLNVSGRGVVDLQSIFLVRGNVEAIRDNAQFGGIGVSIGRRKDELKVMSIIDGTPAQNAGLQAGDSIISVNGQPSGDLTIDEAIALIRGDERTAVMLKVRRGDRTFDINIVRDTIKP